jgi:hypothetical protein
VISIEKVTCSGLDQFNRIIDQRWQNNVPSSPTDIDRYQYGYDQNSNRQWKRNVASGSLETPVRLDGYYTYDSLNRLIEMKRGTLVGTPVREWTTRSERLTGTGALLVRNRMALGVLSAAGGLTSFPADTGSR